MFAILCMANRSWDDDYKTSQSIQAARVMANNLLGSDHIFEAMFVTSNPRHIDIPSALPQRRRFHASIPSRSPFNWYLKMEFIGVDNALFSILGI